MSDTQPKSSFVIRYLGPLVPMGFAAFGSWILFSGSYSFRPGRSNQVVTLLPPDSWLAAVFFLSLAALLVAFGLQGRAERSVFWIGLIGCLVAIAAVGFRQIAGFAVIGWVLKMSTVSLKMPPSVVRSYDRRYLQVKSSF
jgi:hypothetical protein